MKRIDRIFQYLLEVWGDSRVEDLQKQAGSTAKEVSQALEIARSNVSAELNKLVRDERVVKIKSYPVRYIPLEILLNNHLMEISDMNFEIEDFVSLDDEKPVKISPTNKSVYKRASDPFQLVIGHNDSLKKAISQAKAAIHYPPNGLHMLLLGPTGSGKTFFAKKVFQYAQYAGIVDEGNPFISFNCADYYNNPQLLMSQLFGYVEGAFTGAASEKSGLIEQADGGILLLDEVHRLPPEGQEMLFYFLDNKTFSRLGESGKSRSANVLIIFATTENPSSVLLSTFTRRIPMTIEIPPLSKRSLPEKIELLKYLFRIEAKRIEKTLSIDIDVMNVLLSSANFGNVGQLKSQVQLVCAQAFVNNLNSKDKIEIHVQDLPSQVGQEWMTSRSNMIGTKDISDYLDVVTLVYPTNDEEENHEDADFNIYESIEKKVKILREEGVSQEDIYQYILTDLHIHIRNVVEKDSPNYSLQKFVNPKITKIVDVLKEQAEQQLNRKFDRRFNYYVGMHLDAYLKRGEKTNLSLSTSHQEIIDTNKKEYEAALTICKTLQERYDIHLPEIEVVYYTMLLSSIISLETVKKVSALVVTHGNSTATSMVDVATELLGYAPIEAVDMPLTVSPAEIIAILCEKVSKIDNGKGVLLLVDMGSLAIMDKKIQKETGVKVLSIPNVTTAVVLDVVRKISYTNFDLHSIYSSVKKDFMNSLQLYEDRSQRPKAILSICMSGEGTAKKLEQMINSIISQNGSEVIEVLTVSALELKQKIPVLVERYELMAAVGTKDPEADCPFISLEALIEGQGEQQLRSIVSGEDLSSLPADNSPNGSMLIKDLCEETLRSYLVYLNPIHITDLLLQWMSDLESYSEAAFSNSTILKMVVHTSFAFERVIKGNCLEYSEEVTPLLEEYLHKVEKSIASVEQKLDLVLSRDEKLFIAEIIKEIS
ncbi:sigma-54-dependent transcriptional regulator [Candidatus Enterococcus ferrettii]|uniref:Uncharacterized protein n=1 Tax=Candidatus Enterococcus ferrettii TaxID=2815324 RepID=A0ABV0ESM2_9ENTE|nr:sigma-54-dependent transcriptional regulator [Enterococcus sp. 665A]MBO1342346.1 sigma 54-interacting transcriptional regulator [Enterococcus sp. 665A]